MLVEHGHFCASLFAIAWTIGTRVCEVMMASCLVGVLLFCLGALVRGLGSTAVEASAVRRSLKLSS